MADSVSMCVCSVLSSDDDGERLPDNDRAASRSKVISGAHRVQRSSRQPPPGVGIDCTRKVTKNNGNAVRNISSSAVRSRD